MVISWLRTSQQTPYYDVIYQISGNLSKMIYDFIRFSTNVGHENVKWILLSIQNDEHYDQMY